MEPTAIQVERSLPARLDALVGDWRIESSIGGRPTGVARVSFVWLGEKSFLFSHAEARAPLPGTPRSWLSNSPFPFNCVICPDDRSGSYCYAYADARGICRVYRMSLMDGTWRIWGRAEPECFRRFEATFSEDGNTITGRWDKSRDGAQWERDFDVRFTRLN